MVDDPGPDDSHPQHPNFAGLLRDAVQSANAMWNHLRPTEGAGAKEWLDDSVDSVLRLGQQLGVDWQGGASDTAAFLRSRRIGDYRVDEFGFDVDFTERVFLPLMQPIVDRWFRVEASGFEKLPDGPALLVANHAGALPVDSLVLQTLIHRHRQRHLRLLGADLVFRIPFVADFARRTGTTYACQEDALRLLAAEHWVAAFPEGFKGLGKPYAERYRLRRFGRGGFVTTAITAGVPIVPVSIVGSEEIYPKIAELPALARLLRVPYFPVTPTFPLLGPLGAVPLPSRWLIRIGDPVDTERYVGLADDPATVFKITDQVRHTIQQTLYELLDERESPFW